MVRVLFYKLHLEIEVELFVDLANKKHEVVIFVSVMTSKRTNWPRLLEL